MTAEAASEAAVEGGVDDDATNTSAPSAEEAELLPAPATSLKSELVNSAAALIDTSMRRAMQPETLSGYVLASQYKKTSSRVGR